MVGNLQPLAKEFQIVGPDGKPTEYFIRWAQQRQIDITDSISLADLEAYLLAHQLQAGTGIVITPDGNISSNPTITLDAGLDDLNDVDLSTPPTDGQALIYDSGIGMWVPDDVSGGGGGGFTVISDQTLASDSSSVTISSIPGSYTDLRLIVEARQNTGALIEFYVRFNSDTGANYTSYTENRFGTATYTDKIRFGASEASGATASVFAPSDGWIYAYSDTSRYKTAKSVSYFPSGTFEDRNSGVWRSNSAITSITLFPGANSFVTGTRIRLLAI